MTLRRYPKRSSLFYADVIRAVRTRAEASGKGEHKQGVKPDSKVKASDKSHSSFK